MVKKFSMGCLILLCLPWLATAQVRTLLPETNAKYITALKVYETIKPYIYNDHNKHPPQLSLVKKQLIAKPASYDAASNSIYIEEAAFDACLSVGADSLSALAALIAHEAMHYFKKHRGERGFACAYFEVGKELDEQRKTQEAEADLWGLMTAYLAGYEVVGIVPNLLDRLYGQYNLPDEMSGYPTLETRKKMFAHSLEKLQDLTALFEAGNYLAAIGEHDKAAACFATILDDYQTHEMCNNLGVAIAAYLASLDDRGPEYPLEMELQSSLYRKPPPFGYAPDALKKYWLPEAEKALLEALKLKADFATANINLSIVYDMMGRYDDALSTIKKARHSRPLLRAQEYHLSIMEGIIEWHRGNPSLGKSILKAVDDPLAAQNLLLLENGGAGQTKAPVIVSPLDRICGESLTANWKSARNIRLKKGILPELTFEFYYKNDSCASAFKVSRPSSNEQVYLQITKDAGARTLKGQGIGTDRQALLNSYGGEQAAIAYAAKNTFIICHGQGLIFQLGIPGKVEGWGIFKVVGR
ncbi:MAG: hypothetical protein R2830_18920 [Saprospiraceae bacterium]